VKDSSGGAHCLGAVFDASGAAGLDLLFDDGEVLRLRSFAAVDASIYGKGNLWSAAIVRCIVCKRGWSFRPGIGLDFSEEDVVTIKDPLTNDFLYQRDRVTPARPQQ
jgi:hypothetical protein